MSEENSTVAKSIRLIVQKLDTYTSTTKKKFFEIEEILDGFRQEIDQLKGSVNALQATPAPTSISSDQLDPIMKRLTELENKVLSVQGSISQTPTSPAPLQPTAQPSKPMNPPSMPQTTPAPPSRPVATSPPKSTPPPVMPPPKSPTPVSTSSIPSSPPVRKPSLPSTPAPSDVKADIPKESPAPVAAPPRGKNDEETKSLMDALKKLDSL